MKHFFLFLFMFFTSVSIYSFTIDKDTKNKLTQLSHDIILNIKEKKIEKLKQFMSPDIKIRQLDKVSLMQLSDNLLNDNISIIEYIIDITGHNIYLFLNKNKILLYKIVLIDKESKYGDTDFYFVKLKVNYKIGNKIYRGKELELDFKKYNNKFILIGFII